MAEQIVKLVPVPVDQADRPPKTTRKFSGHGRQLTRMLNAGETDRLTGNWPSMPLTADDIIRRNQRTVVARSREQCANNDYGRAFMRMCRQNIVGPRGVTMQAQVKNRRGELETETNDAIEQAFRIWGHRNNCDVTGTQSWRAMQGSSVVTAGKDGEFMIRKVYGADAGPWGFALQMLDPQRCPVDFDIERLSGGRFVRHGIEFNSYGRPLAYYFTAIDAQNADYTFGGRHFTRVDASEIIHGFVSDMVGQKRGLPWTATGLWRMRMLAGFENAALVNARTSASKAGFFEWQDGYGPEADEDSELYMEADPGTFQELPAGVRFREWNPQYPAGEFLPFHKTMVRGFSAGFGVAYNNLANDLENVNFSSIRQGSLDERENWKELQEWLIESLVIPVFEAWLPRALLAGKIRVNGRPLDPSLIDKYSDVNWQPRRWAWIDPRADMDAAERSKNNLFTSPSQIITDQGRDPQSVWREIARDIKSMQDAGIPDKYIQLAMNEKLSSGGAPNE